MSKRMEKLTEEKNKADHPELVLLYAMFAKHQVPSEPKTISPAEVQLAYAAHFKNANEDQIANAGPSRLAVFQQALIRSWVALSKDLIKYEVLPLEAAIMVVAAFEKSLIPNGMRFLSSSVYTQRMLWIGERVNQQTGWAKLAWTHLLISTLAMKGPLEAAITALEDSRSGRKLESDVRELISTSMRTLAREHVALYLDELESQLYKFYKSSFSEVLQDEAEINHLRDLQKSINSDDKKKFKQEISKLATQRFAEAKSKLLGQLGLKLVI